jgi:hypothetical protein
VKKWGIKHIEFEPEVRIELKDFVEKNPAYKKLLDDRLNDLMNFPELVWQSAFIESEDVGYFLTRNQQIELAGKAYKAKHLVLITHFSFHR